MSISGELARNCVPAIALARSNRSTCSPIHRSVPQTSSTYAPLWQRDGVIERQFQARPATLGRPLLARMVNENAPHRLRGDREKMVPILPLRAITAGEAQVRLVDERRAL